VVAVSRGEGVATLAVDRVDECPAEHGQADVSPELARREPSSVYAIPEVNRLEQFTLGVPVIKHGSRVDEGGSEGVECGCAEDAPSDVGPVRFPVTTQVRSRRLVAGRD